MDELPATTRRTLLKMTGVVAGTAVFSGMGYATTNRVASSPPRVKWTTEVPDHSGRFDSLAQSNDGGIGVVGFKSFRKLSPDGDIQWTRTFTREKDDFYEYPQLTTACPARDGGFVIAGRLSGSWTAIAIKLAPDGSVVWRRREDMSVENPQSMVQRPDGGYAIAGGNGPHGPKGAEVLLLSEAGEVEANKKFKPETTRFEEVGEDGNRNEGFNDIAATADGGYALAGVAQYDNYTRGAWHLSLDSALNKQWEYTPKNTDTFDTVLSLGETVAFAPGRAGESKTGSTGAFGFSTYTAEGEVDEVHEYYGEDAATFMITQRTTGEIVLEGDANGSGWLLGTELDGEKHWEGEIPSTASIEVLISTADGGLAAVGEDGDRHVVTKLTFDDSSEEAAETPTETDPGPATATEQQPETHSERATETATTTQPESATDSPAESTTRPATETQPATDSATETATPTRQARRANSATATASDRGVTAAVGSGFGPLATLGGLSVGVWRLLCRSDDE